MKNNGIEVEAPASGAFEGAAGSDGTVAVVVVSEAPAEPSSGITPWVAERMAEANENRNLPVGGFGKYLSGIRLG